MTRINNKMKKIVFVLTLSVALSAAAIFFLSGRSQKAMVHIPRGSSAFRAAEILSEKDVIGSKKIFIYLLRASGKINAVKSGWYEFAGGETVFAVINKIVRGLSYRVKVTVPEGYNSTQIAHLLSSKGVADYDKFLEYVAKNKLEGYLFPETYFFELDASEATIAEIMKREFFKKITPEMKERLKELKLSLEQLIILASMIEKEATKDDAPLVSAVFHNRLKKKMYLESCATILYTLKKHKNRLTYKDLKVKSPYNTYLNYGLPPGPIANPGMRAIKAALYPAQTDALFFVVDSSSGAHVFTRYYKEHIEVQRKKRK